MSKLKILFPPEAAEEYWGKAKERARPGYFDPFSVPKVNIPGRTGIRQPNAAHMPDLDRAWTASEKPPPPMPEEDENFLVKIISENFHAPAVEGLCLACGRFNWAKLFARFFDEREFSFSKHTRRNSNPDLEQYRNYNTLRPYIMEFGDWWSEGHRHPYPIAPLVWTLHHREICSLWYGHRATLHICAEGLINSPVGNNTILSFELLDDGVFPLRSLTTRRKTNKIRWAVPYIPETQLDITTVKQWLFECDAHERCQLDRIHRAKGQSFRLRLVDVVNNEVIRPWKACRYIALSYVWGNTQQYRAKKADLFCCDKDHVCGSNGRPVLLIDRSKLPRTIQDAMYLVEAIGERYLWVDAICIIQDDETELNNTLKCMSKVYEEALFTIVAGDGENADSGLLGVRPESRKLKNVTGIVDGIHLIQERPRLDLSSTAWAQRAWTFQEAVFSRKWLIFVGSCAYYGCSQGIFPEHKPDDFLAESSRYRESMTFDAGCGRIRTSARSGATIG